MVSSRLEQNNGNEILIFNNNFESEEPNHLLVDAMTFLPTVVIQRNIFTSSTSNLEDTASIYLRVGIGGQMTIDGNIFYKCWKALKLESTRPFNSSNIAPTIISRNRFIDNTADGTVKIIHEGDDQEQVFVTDNHFVGNSIGQRSMMYFDGYGLHMSQNYFENTHATYDIWFDAVFNDIRRPINATLNWWGSNNESYVDKRIHGNIENNAAAVIYKPFLTEPYNGDVLQNWPCVGPDCSCEQGRQ